MVAFCRSSRLQHGGDTSAAVLDRVRGQIRERDFPERCGDEVRLLLDPRLDRVHLQSAGRLRVHVVLQEEEEGQGTDGGDRYGRRTDDHRPLIRLCSTHLHPCKSWEMMLVIQVDTPTETKDVCIHIVRARVRATYAG